MPHIRRLAPLALAAAVCVLAAGCGGSSSDDQASATTTTSSSKPIRVVATTTQLGDIVREVGGDAVDVHQILQPNTDPHEYEPRPRDVTALTGARLVVTSGDGLDAWIDKLVTSSGDGATVLDAGEGRPVALPADEEHGDEHGDGHEHGHSDHDPHWWGDPDNVAYATDRIADALIAAEPGRRAEIERSAADYRRKIEETTKAVAACIAQLPESERKLVTDHDAFGYYTKRFHLTTIGTIIPAQTTQAQPSARDLARLTDVIRREHVKAIFPESSVAPRLAKAIAAQTGASTGTKLYADTLGPAGTPAATYLGMLRANTDAIVRGLSGDRLHCE